MEIIYDIFWNITEGSRDSRIGHAMLLIIGAAIVWVSWRALSGRHKKWAAFGVAFGSSTIVFIFCDIINSANALLAGRLH